MLLLLDEDAEEDENSVDRPLPTGDVEPLPPEKKDDLARRRENLKSLACSTGHTFPPFLHPPASAPARTGTRGPRTPPPPPQKSNKK